MKNLLVAFLFLISWSAFPQGAPPPRSTGPGSGTVAIASPTEAVTGTNDTKAMTPAKTKLAIQAVTDTALANRAKVSQLNSVSAAVGTREPSTNKKTSGALGSSTTQFPVEAVVKAYVDIIAAAKLNSSSAGTFVGKNEASTLADSLDPTKAFNARLTYLLIKNWPLDLDLFLDSTQFEGSIFQKNNAPRLRQAFIKTIKPRRSESIRFQRDYLGSSKIAENIPHTLLNAGSAIRPDTIYFALLPILDTDTADGLGYYLRQVGNFQTPVGKVNQGALFRFSADRTTLTRVAQTDTAAAMYRGGTTEFRKTAFQSRTILPPGLYAVALLHSYTGTVSSGSRPQFSSITGGTAASNRIDTGGMSMFYTKAATTIAATYAITDLIADPGRWNSSLYLNQTP